MVREGSTDNGRMLRKQLVTLKRKYAELSGKIDRLHRQVRTQVPLAALLN